MGLSTIEVAEARKATSDPVIIPVRVMLSIAFYEKCSAMYIYDNIQYIDPVINLVRALGIAFLKALATNTTGNISCLV